MKRIKLNKYFFLDEYFSEKYYKKNKHQLKKLVWKLDPELLEMDFKLREFFDTPIIINNWATGGKYNYRGFREKGCKYYKDHSLHSVGRASDKSFLNLKASKVIKFISENPEKFEYIKGLELGVNWVHTDTRNSKDLIKFYP